MKGKWWRPEDLGIVDYSQQSLANSTSVIDALIGNSSAAGGGAQKGNDFNGNRLQSVGGPTSLYNDQDVLVRQFTCFFTLADSNMFVLGAGSRIIAVEVVHNEFPQLFLTIHSPLAQVLTSDIVPLVPGLLDGLDLNNNNNGESRSASPFPAFPTLSRRNTEVPYDGE